MTVCVARVSSVVARLVRFSSVVDVEVGISLSEVTKVDTKGSDLVEVCMITTAGPVEIELPGVTGEGVLMSGVLGYVVLNSPPWLVTSGTLAMTGRVVSTSASVLPTLTSERESCVEVAEVAAVGVTSAVE